MLDLICPYSATLAQKSHFLCPDADEVIRRGGAEYICLKANRYEICNEVHSKVKQIYLEGEGLEDDLLSLPHSTFVKIQFGCILGLQSSLERDVSIIEDMGSLITDAMIFYKTIDTLPFELISNQISIYKLQKRGKRR